MTGLYYASPLCPVISVASTVCTQYKFWGKEYGNITRDTPKFG